MSALTIHLQSMNSVSQSSKSSHTVSFSKTGKTMASLFRTAATNFASSCVQLVNTPLIFSASLFACVTPTLAQIFFPPERVDTFPMHLDIYNETDQNMLLHQNAFLMSDAKTIAGTATFNNHSLTWLCANMNHSAND